MLTKFTQKLYTVCPSDMILRTANEPNCLIALFLGKADLILSKCKRLVLNGTFESVWIPSPDASYWIYCLCTPQRVTIQCQEVGSAPTYQKSAQLLQNATGKLLNSSSCYIYAENFKLLPHSIGKTEVEINRAHIVLPIIENVLTFSEEVVLQCEPSAPIDLQHLNEISTRTASKTWIQGTDATKLVNVLRESEQQPIWLGVLCIVITFVIGFLSPIWFKFIKRSYFSWRKNAPNPPLKSLCKTDVRP